MNLVKLKIYALDDPTGSPDEGKKFTVSVNPEKLTLNREIQLNDSDVGNTAGGVTQFKSYAPDTLAFDLFFDGTGIARVADGGEDIIGTAGDSDVDKQIVELENIVFKYEGEKHKPNYLLVSWSSMVFRCQLNKWNIDYSLFKPDGTPLRAKVSLSFKGVIDAETREKLANKSSPDLTHVKTIRLGDSLPLLCKEIYGDFKYYLQVAEYNGLTNFRSVAVGSQVVFPPLDK